MAYNSKFSSEQIEHKLGLVHGVPTLDHEPASTDLSYEDDVLGTVTFNIGDRARYLDGEEYKLYTLVDIADGAAVWSPMNVSVSENGDYVLDIVVEYSGSDTTTIYPQTGTVITLDEDTFNTIYNGVTEGKALRIRTICGYFWGITTTFMATTMDGSKSQVSVNFFSTWYTTDSEGRVVSGVFYTSAHTITFQNATMNYLGLDNTVEYLPTEDYHPATKKYVDDSLKKSDGDLDPENSSVNPDFIDLTVYFDDTFSKNETSQLQVGAVAKISSIQVDTALLTGEKTAMAYAIPISDAGSHGTASILKILPIMCLVKSQSNRSYISIRIVVDDTYLAYDLSRPYSEVIAVGSDGYLYAAVESYEGDALELIP